MSGTMATFVGSAVALFVFRVTDPQLAILNRQWPLLIAFALVHGIDTGLENLSIVYISISLNQVIKATTPAMTLVLTCLFENRRYTKAMVLSTMLTVVGVALAVLRNPELRGNGIWGVLAASLSACGSAVSTIILAILLQRININGLTIAFVTSLLSVISLFPAFALFEYPSLDRWYRRRWSAPVARLVLLTSALAFLYNVSRFFFIKYTTAHYSVLAGNLKVVVLVLLSMVVFGRTFATLNYVGMVISLCAFFAYNHFKLKQLRTAPKHLKAFTEDERDGESGGGAVDTDDERLVELNEMMQQ